LTVAIAHLPALRQALAEAEQIARREGLLPDSADRAAREADRA